MQDKFIHHVFFWLKNTDNQTDQLQLIAGLEKLAAISTIQEFHIGVPATTSRDVIDGSYAVSWLAIFENKNDQDSYQVDPIHLEFVATCSQLWEKVIVYDSVNQ